MESSYKKIISGVLFLIASVFDYLSNTIFPEIIVCFALITITMGIFEYRGYSNRFVYWSSISVILASTLISGYILARPLHSNELFYYILIGIFAIGMIWYSLSEFKNLKKVKN
jgi:hypothetical protein